MIVYGETVTLLWMLDLVLARMSILAEIRTTDVILRLSKSTIEDLSVYIGFVNELMVKMVVDDEPMTFVRFFVKIKHVFVFDLFCI